MQSIVWWFLPEKPKHFTSDGSVSFKHEEEEPIWGGPRTFCASSRASIRSESDCRNSSCRPCAWIRNRMLWHKPYHVKNFVAYLLPTFSLIVQKRHQQVSKYRWNASSTRGVPITRSCLNAKCEYMMKKVYQNRERCRKKGAAIGLKKKQCQWGLDKGVQTYRK